MGLIIILIIILFLVIYGSYSLTKIMHNTKMTKNAEEYNNNAKDALLCYDILYKPLYLFDEVWYIRARNGSPYLTKCEIIQHTENDIYMKDFGTDLIDKRTLKKCKKTSSSTYLIKINNDDKN